MPNYAAIYEINAQRAIDQGVSDLEAFVRLMNEAGVPVEEVERLLLQDLETDGPIFGRFFRGIGAAADSSSIAAFQAGTAVSMAARDGALDAIGGFENATGFQLSDLDAILDEADPEVLDVIDRASADHLEKMWVAELKNTCHLCLPLHGQIRTAQEWREMGKDPTTIHPGSWGTMCQCKFVAITDEDSLTRAEQLKPLVRNKLVSPTGLKGNKRTIRGVTQKDLDKAQAARDKVLAKDADGNFESTIEQRRALRLAGQVNK